VEKSAEVFAVYVACVVISCHALLSLVACINYRGVSIFFIYLTASQQDNVLFEYVIGVSSCYYCIRDVCCAYTKVATDVTLNMCLH